ncbi:hypothetical protein EYF80_004418 [Liparis tanakae]|uniref:Uncharacterized protein n=1 Tax=Liparis tanakae TaxID=230148 RepID=A0A4Z2J5E2_9TELE|nr:hypothetical protein EYF80_004418 [Liparis tanakae]
MISMLPVSYRGTDIEQVGERAPPPTGWSSPRVSSSSSFSSSTAATPQQYHSEVLRVSAATLIHGVAGGGRSWRNQRASEGHAERRSDLRCIPPGPLVGSVAAVSRGGCRTGIFLLTSPWPLHASQLLSVDLITGGSVDVFLKVYFELSEVVMAGQHIVLFILMTPLGRASGH